MMTAGRPPRPRMATVLDQTITIALDNDTKVEVDALVWDQWAAHKAWGRMGWSVTHAPTGRRVPSRDLTEKEARLLATVLAKRGIFFTPEEGSNGNFPERVSDQVKEILLIQRLIKPGPKAIPRACGLKIHAGGHGESVCTLMVPPGMATHPGPCR